MFKRFLVFIITFSFMIGFEKQVLANTQVIKKTDFVDIKQMIPSVELDIKYATVNNFTHTKLYESPKAILRKGTADKLKEVAEEVAREKGYRLKIWDSYRISKAQFKMWDLIPDSRYVANPTIGYSNHSRGSAIDLTLVNEDGNEVKMPTGFDDFTVASSRENENSNAQYLEKVMIKHGFKPLATEWWHYDDTDPYDPVDVLPVQQNIEKSKITISAIGDVTLGQDDRFIYKGSFNDYYKLKGFQYFYSDVRKILQEDDLTIANLEGTLTNLTKKPDKSFQGDKAFFFKGSPSYTAILIDGSIEAVDLANNHSMDYQEEGFKDTEISVERVGIKSFGYDKLAIYETKGVKIGLIGINTLGRLEEGVNLLTLEFDLANKIRFLKDQTSLIIVSFHWGTENTENPTSEQRYLGRFAIEQGAGLVLGHHPHVIQPIEEYQGKTIVYSLGNFVFGGNSNPRYKTTEIFRQTFDFENGKLMQISPPLTIPCKLEGRFKPEPILNE